MEANVNELRADDTQWSFNLQNTQNTPRHAYCETVRSSDEDSELFVRQDAPDPPSTSHEQQSNEPIYYNFGEHQRLPRFDPFTVQERIHELDDEDVMADRATANGNVNTDSYLQVKTGGDGGSNNNTAPKVKSEFEWNDSGSAMGLMSSNPIDLSDNSGDNSNVPIKTEPGFEWRDMGRMGSMSSDPIDLEPSMLFGPRKPIRRQHDPQEVLRLQKLYGARALEGREQRTGAGGIFHLPRPSQASQPGLEDDGFEWMQSEVIPDDPAPDTSFKKLKAIYKMKKTARKLTFEDEVEYKRASVREASRLKRLAHDAADSDVSQAEESDDGTCLPQNSFLGLGKGPLVDFDDDNEDDETLMQALTGRSLIKDAKWDLPLDGRDDKDSRKRQREYAKERVKEEKYNMLAGIEAVMLRHQAKKDKRIAKEATKLEQKKRKKCGGGPWRQQANESISLTAQRQKTGRMADVGSLFNNVYQSNKLSQQRPTLRHVDEKRKKELLAALVANVPLDYDKQARQDKADIIRATRILMLRGMKAHDQSSWEMRGMQSALFHHQVQGAAFMKSRELREEGPFGGLLADSMGLGKTIMMLALMVAHRQANPGETRCTLIVCSPALLRQWEDEISKHVKPEVFRVVSRHSCQKRYDGKGAETQMEEADVILTTYGEVVRSYPSIKLPAGLEDNTQREKWWGKHWDANRGFLHRAYFYRVVLDEAQQIKNHTSQTSVACRALMAKHRWAISGTPIQNSLEELFPYFKFLRVSCTGSLAIYRQNFLQQNSNIGNKRLISIIAGMMIRRDYNTPLLGHRLVELPDSHQNTITVKLNKVEQYIYQLVCDRLDRAIGWAQAEGDEEKEALLILSKFTRTRQMAAHIFMVQEVIEKDAIDSNGTIKLSGLDNFWEPGYIPTSLETTMLDGLKKIVSDKLSGVVNHEPEIGKHFHTKKSVITERASDEVPESVETEGEAAKPKAQGQSKNENNLLKNFASHLRLKKRTRDINGLRECKSCQYCHDLPQEPMVLSCYHVYCRGCLTQLALDAATNDQDKTACGKCGLIFTEVVSCRALKEMGYGDIAAPVLSAPGNSTTPDADEDKKPSKNYKLTAKYVDSRHSLILSTKLQAVKDELAKSLHENPDRKIVVFSDWLMVQYVLGRVCEQEGWRHCSYNGQMSQDAREATLNVFEKTPQVKVLIASLKAGGVGLNLSAASKVICIDLWFNSCVEQQAFCRVHRIGQQEETHISRIRAAYSIDDILLKMQKRKEKAIEAVMDDKEILATLTTKEVVRLFGPVAMADDESFLMVDDDEELPNLPWEEKDKKSRAPRSDKGKPRGKRGGATSGDVQETENNADTTESRENEKDGIDEDVNMNGQE